MINDKAKIIQGVAWIEIIAGIIGSFLLGKLYPIASISGFSSAHIDEKYNWPIVIIGLIVSVLSGILLFGFAEIIDLLQVKVDQTKKELELLNKINTSINLNNEKNDQNFIKCI
jgi:hypothetical protein